MDKQEDGSGNVRLERQVRRGIRHMEYCAFSERGEECDCGCMEAMDALNRLVAELDAYKKAIQSILPTQDPLDAELICDWCGASVDLDETEVKHDADCPWLLAHGDA